MSAVLKSIIASILVFSLFAETSVAAAKKPKTNISLTAPLGLAGQIQLTMVSVTSKISTNPYAKSNTTPTP